MSINNSYGLDCLSIKTVESVLHVKWRVLLFCSCFSISILIHDFVQHRIQEEIYGVNDKATSLVSGELLGTTLKYETASKLERIHFFDVVRPS